MYALVYMCDSIDVIDYVYINSSNELIPCVIEQSV